MRTTVTLDADTASIIDRLMNERGIGFKQAINDAIRASAPSGERPPFVTPVIDMGVPLVDLTKAMKLAGQLDDEHQMKVMGLKYADDDA